MLLSKLMNLSIVFTVVLFFCSFAGKKSTPKVNANAAADSITIQQHDSRFWEDSIKKLEGEYNYKIKEKQKQIEEKHKQVLSLNDSVRQLNQRIEVAEQRINDLGSENNKLRKEKEAFYKELLHTDTLTMQVIEVRMGFRCSDKSIQELRRSFDDMRNIEYQQQNKPWDDLLAIYSQTYIDIYDISKEARQKILNAEPMWKNSGIIELKKRLHELPFYKRYYSANEDAAHSNYLKTMVDETEKLLSETATKADYDKYVKTYKASWIK